MTDMLVKLYDIPDPTPQVNGLCRKGILIRTARSYEKHIVVQWVKNCFTEGWASECEVAFSNHPISCLIATKAGTIIGFACYDSTCKNFFGPTGVAQTEQGNGIGKALLLSCLNLMASNGYAYAIIGGAGVPDYYARVVGAITIQGSSPGIYGDTLIQKSTDKPSFSECQSMSTGI